MAQSKRELTPDIVKAALYGPAAAKIPAPQINLSAVPAPQLNASVSAPAPLPGAVGYGGPSVPTSSTQAQQHFTPQGSQLVRPPQVVSASAPQPTHNIPTRGFSGGGGAAAAARPNSSSIAGDWSTGTLNGPSSGSMLQVSSLGAGPSATPGFEFALTASKAPPATTFWDDPA